MSRLISSYPQDVAVKVDPTTLGQGALVHFSPGLFVSARQEMNAKGICPLMEALGIGTRAVEDGQEAYGCGN